MGAKINIRDNKELMRFETGEGDNTAYLEYRFYKRIVSSPFFRANVS